MGISNPGQGVYNYDALAIELKVLHSQVQIHTRVYIGAVRCAVPVAYKQVV